MFQNVLKKVLSLSASLCLLSQKKSVLNFYQLYRVNVRYRQATTRSPVYQCNYQQIDSCYCYINLGARVTYGEGWLNIDGGPNVSTNDFRNKFFKNVSGIKSYVFFSQGDYTTIVEFISSGEQIGCFQTEFSLKTVIPGDV